MQGRGGAKLGRAGTGRWGDICGCLAQRRHFKPCAKAHANHAARLPGKLCFEARTEPA